MLLLVLSVLGLLLVLNGLRPVRLNPFAIPAFFAAWLVVELAPWVLVLHVAGVVALVVVRGLHGLALLGLALSVVTAAGLVWMVVEAGRAESVADAVVRDLAPGEPHRSSRVRRYFVPMRFTDAAVERLADVAYGELGKRNRLDVYRTFGGELGRPALLQVHGGGWVIGDKKQQGRPLMLEMARRGWVCFAPNYRLSPRATWPDHLVDVKRAIAWVREHAEEYGADPGFLVVTGGSAGGHLAALAALTANDPEFQPGFEDADTTVQGCVPFYGVYDLEGETQTKAYRVRHESLMAKLVMKTREPSVFQAASPLARVHADAPPFLVIHGRNDTLVPVEEARLLVSRLRAVTAAPVLYLELPGTQHAFDVFPSIRTGHVVRVVARFLEAVRANAREGA